MFNPLKFLKKKTEIVEKVPTFKINNRAIEITPVSYDEILEVVFLLLPYIKLVRVVKAEHKSNLDPVIFFDIVENLILQLNRKDFNRILVLTTHQDEEFINTLTHKDLIMIAPTIITVNHLIETMFLLRNLGAFE